MRSKRAKRKAKTDVGDGGDADECPLVSLAHQVMTPIAAHLSGDDLSALARTLMRRVSSAHRMTLARSALSPTAEIRETEPRITSPSSPSREITSPSLNFASLP